MRMEEEEWPSMIIDGGKRSVFPPLVEKIDPDFDFADLKIL